MSSLTFSLIFFFIPEQLFISKCREIYKKQEDANKERSKQSPSKIPKLFLLAYALFLHIFVSCLLLALRFPHGLAKQIHKNS